MTKDERGTYLTRLFGKAPRPGTPYDASFELTYARNLACAFCYNPVQRKGQTRSKPLALRQEAPSLSDEIVDVLDQLKDLGILYLTLTGGEPLLHPRFWDIAQAAKDRLPPCASSPTGRASRRTLPTNCKRSCPNALKFQFTVQGTRRPRP